MNTFIEEEAWAMARVALCKRLTEILQQAAKARKAIVDHDRYFSDNQVKMFEGPKSSVDV